MPPHKRPLSPVLVLTRRHFLGTPLLVIALALFACGDAGSGHPMVPNAVERAIGHDVEELERLLEQGADPDDGDQGQPLVVAVQVPDPRFAELLIKYGAEVDRADSDNWTPLFAAAALGPPETVTLLLYHGADPCRRTSLRFRDKHPPEMRPLEWAEAAGNEENIPVLQAATAKCN